MHRLFVIFAIVTGTAVAQSSTPSIPKGLWQAKDEGFVVRVEACDGGFCGVIAGATASGKKNPQDTCGKPIFVNFTWNQSSGKWFGQTHPPDKDMTLNSQIETDGNTYLKMHAHMGIISKTIAFTPYTGKIGLGCQLEP